MSWHKVNGVVQFSLFIDTNLLPSDFPFNYQHPLDWAVDARTVFGDVLKWKDIEVGDNCNFYDLDDLREYDRFEIFGPTPSGSACRMWYCEKKLAGISREMKGIVSSLTDEIAKRDFNSIKNAFTGYNNAYNFLVDPVRGYP